MGKPTTVIAPTMRPSNTFGIDRDPDQINQMLWKRKNLKKRRERNDIKKVRKSYFKDKEQSTTTTTTQVIDQNSMGDQNNKVAPAVDEKK